MTETIKGMNHGSGFNAAQLTFKDNGFMPYDFVQKLKEAIPKDMRNHIRMTGTQSNSMALNVKGYGHAQFDAQLKKHNTEAYSSYWHAFIRFYLDWGFESAAITVNSHSSYINGVTSPLKVEEDVCMLLTFLQFHGVNISHIELENESYFYPAIVGMAKGSPSLFENLRYGFKTEQRVFEQCQKWQSHLNYVADRIRYYYPNIPIGVSVENPNTMRGRAYNKAVFERRYYDFIAPHIYITDVDKVDLEVRKHLTALPTDVEKRVTEFQWNYQEKPKGHNITDAQLLERFERAFKENGVKVYYWHCLWNRFDANGWARDVKV